MSPQTQLDQFCIGKLGPDNNPISQVVLPAITSAAQSKKGPGRPAHLPDPSAQEELQQIQAQTTNDTAIFVPPSQPRCVPDTSWNRHQSQDTKSHLVAVESSYVGLETELYQQLDCRDPKASF